MISAGSAVKKQLVQGRAVHKSNGDLIRDCLAGRQAAWNELVERYTRLVYSVPRRCGLNESDAEDVHQNVFLLLYRKLEGLRDDQRLASWLVTTAQRESWRVGRRNKPGPEAEWDTVAASEPDEHELERLELQNAVRQALRRLGGRCEALLLALFSAQGDPNYEAIANDLGMAIGSIGPTRARCLSKLEPILAEIGIGAEEILGAAVSDRS